MANNDYWAYLREQRELRNDELMHYRVGGERSGYTKYPDKYKPVGDKAKGFFDRAGNYISTVATNISNKVNKGVHDIKTTIRNKRMESKRTNYGDMKSNTAKYTFDNDKYYDARVKNPYNVVTPASAPMGKEEFRQTRGFNVDTFLKSNEIGSEVDKIILDMWKDVGYDSPSTKAEIMTPRIAWKLCQKYGMPYRDEIEAKVGALVKKRCEALNAEKEKERSTRKYK